MQLCHILSWSTVGVCYLVSKLNSIVEPTKSSSTKELFIESLESMLD